MLSLPLSLLLSSSSLSRLGAGCLAITEVGRRGREPATVVSQEGMRSSRGKKSMWLKMLGAPFEATRDMQARMSGLNTYYFHSVSDSWTEDEHRRYSQ